MKSFYSRILLFLIPFLIQSYLLLFYLRVKRVAVYGTNDDALIASFSVDPDLGVEKDNWIFLKSLLSMPATYIQNYFPGIGIYGIVLGFTIILATSSLYILISYLPTNFLKLTHLILYTALAVIFDSIAMINPTYTGAAIFAGASGFALIFFNITSNKQNYLDVNILASILIGLSFLIRTESFLLTLGFYLLLLGSHFVFTRGKKLQFKNLIIPGVIFSFIFLINLGLDRINYQSHEWQEFLSLNGLRHSIQLRTAEFYLDKNLSEVSWTEENFDMFQKFSLFDDQILNKESLDELIRASEFTRGVEAILNSNIRNQLIFIHWSYFIYGGFDWIIQIIFLIVIVLIATIGNRSPNFLAYLLAILLISIAINFVFAVSYHLPPRLTFNYLFLLASSVMIVAVLEATKLQNVQKSTNIFTILAIASLFLFTYVQFPKELSAKIAVNKAELNLFSNQRKSIKEFKSINPDATLVGTGSTLIYYYQNPYSVIKNLDTKDGIIISGWHNSSPSSKSRIAARGFPPNNFQKEILTNPDIYWIDSENAQNLLQKFFQQYSSKKVIAQDIGYLGDPFFRIFKIYETN